jgi:phosphatidylglycerophosphate synthase
LAAVGISPNQISVLSIVFAMLGALGLFQLSAVESITQAIAFSVLALVGIQGRLICNLLDGLVAIEGGKKTPVGDLYNEVPDRISDTLLIVAAGLALNKVMPYGALLGMTAGLAALSTAYVRLLGGSLGLPQNFHGPMAKQHRMALLNIGVLLSCVEYAFRGEVVFSMAGVLTLILLGSLLTTYLRLRGITKALNQRSQ